MNFLRPVTAASASTRLRGLPMTRNSEGSFIGTVSGTVCSAAAAVASDP